MSTVSIWVLCICCAASSSPQSIYSLAHEVLQHRTLARTLTADHRDLRQIELHVHTALCEGILQLVDQRNQLFHAPIARRHDEGCWGALL